MSIDHLLDGTCRLWTHTEAASSLDADTWAVGVTVACYLAPAEPGRLDTGAGMRDVRTRQLFAPLGAPLAAEQVVDMVTGPEAPSLWRVVSVPQRPRTHHTEAYVEPWHGTLPEEGS